VFLRREGGPEVASGNKQLPSKEASPESNIDFGPNSESEKRKGGKELKVDEARTLSGRLLKGCVEAKKGEGVW